MSAIRRAAEAGNRKRNGTIVSRRYMELNNTVWAIVLYLDIYRVHKQLETLTRLHVCFNLVFSLSTTVGKLLSAVSHKDALSDRLYNMT
jgi:hypothetical protein